MVKEIKKCAYEKCELMALSQKHKYCSDSHRRYAYKKRHWNRYLLWQRDYFKRKRIEQKKAVV